MNITINPDSGRPGTEVTLAGRFDGHEAPAFRAAVDQLLADSHTDLRVDLSAVEFVDSAALAELVRGMKHCRQAGGDLRLASPSNPVRVILELTRLDLAFAID